MQELLQLTPSAPLSITTLAINLLISLVLSLLVAWFYTQYGRSLSNRERLAQSIPVLALITVLIISIVKSSLALSLGLVGALSIVRFRTAVKEPEELVYLFMAIAIGLGLGADQRWPTIVAVLIILGFLFSRTILTSRPSKSNLFLNVVTPDQDTTFTQINEALTSTVKEADSEAAGSHQRGVPGHLPHRLRRLQDAYPAHGQPAPTNTQLRNELRGARQHSGRLETCRDWANLKDWPNLNDQSPVQKCTVNCRQTL
jgi:hypothetical protein